MIDGVPECDCGRDQGEAACLIALLLEAAVPDLSETPEEDSPGKSVAHFASVETGVNAFASALGSGVYSSKYGLLTANTINGNIPRNA